jgi:uncharacterized phage protein (TIGR02218 family)
MKDFSPLSLSTAAIGFPARLCVVTRKDGAVFRFAESDEAITVDGDVYAVVSGLNISAVKHTSNGEMPSCQIVVVHSDQSVFETSVIDIGLFDAARVELYMVNRMDLSRKGLLFTGSIGNITYTIENLVTFDVKGVGQFANVLMTQRRSPMCRTDLFSELCGVNKDDYAVATTVDALVGPFNFTVTGALSNPDGWFNQGVAVTSSGIGIEIGNWSQSSQTITTYLPSNRLLTAGDSLTLYPGCDKTMGPNGSQKFHNQINFQGEPFFAGTAAAAQRS